MFIKMLVKSSSFRSFFKLLTILALIILIIDCAPSRQTTKPSFPPRVNKLSTPEIIIVPGLEKNSSKLSTTTDTPNVETIRTENIIDTLSPEVSPTFTIEPPENGIYMFMTDGAYIFYPIDDGNVPPPTSIRMIDVKDLISPSQNNKPGPGDALYLSFANFADKIAYWTSGSPGKLYFADKDYSNPVLIFTDTGSIYPIDIANPPGELIKLYWSPDDLNIVVEIPDKTDLNLKYHLPTSTLESFPYTCDKIAFSLKSNKYTTWCTGTEDYAVLEWGGEIWYSQQAPEKLLVQQKTDSFQTWAWSPNGVRIAFYDQADGGALRIVDSYGNPLLQTLHVSYDWAGSLSKFNHRLIEPPWYPIIWSNNGQRLVVYGRGSTNNPCPFNSEDISENDLQNLCWQVIDTTSGNIIWNLSESIEDLIQSVSLSDTYPHAFSYPSISPDGRYLFLVFEIPEHKNFALIDVDSNVVQTFDFFYISNLKWGYSYIID